MNIVNNHSLGGLSGITISQRDRTRAPARELLTGTSLSGEPRRTGQGRFAAEAGLRSSEAGRGVRAYEDPGQATAGARAERAGRHRLHATSCPGDHATRLRGGNAASACCAASLITEAVTTSRATGCTGTLVGPDGLSVLRRPSLLGRPQSRCASLRHRPRGSQGPRRDRRYPRRRLETDPLPPQAIWDVIEALAAPVRAGRRGESRQILPAHPGEIPS